MKRVKLTPWEKIMRADSKLHGVTLHFSDVRVLAQNEVVQMLADEACEKREMNDEVNRREAILQARHSLDAVKKLRGDRS